MKKNKFLKIISTIIIVIYIASYYVSNSGYYEYHVQKETVITNEKIKRFEEDIALNKEVDLLDYINEKEKNYSNQITNFFYEISNGGTKITRKVMKVIFKKLNYLLED